MKPEHTAWTSNAAQPCTPSLRCTMLAVDGNTMSGVDVATMIRSMSAAVQPAASSARLAAVVARSLACTSSATKWRARMPVRSTIHSSEVSTPRLASICDQVVVGQAQRRQVAAGAGDAGMAGGVNLRVLPSACV